MKGLLIFLGIIVIIVIILREVYPIKFLKKEEKKELYEIMNNTDKFMRKNNLKYFMTGGTLLGAVRHSGIIPYDKDVDIAMIEDDFEKLVEIKDDLKNFGLQLDYADYIWRLKKENNPTMYIDVFLYKKIGDKYIYNEEKNLERWPNEYIYDGELFPLVELKFGDNNLYAPKEYKKILVRSYGEDYMTPYYFAQGSDWFDKLITNSGRRAYL